METRHGKNVALNFNVLPIFFFFYSFSNNDISRYYILDSLITFNHIVVLVNELNLLLSLKKR